MRLSNREIALWAPRVVGIGLGLFLSLFALDALTEYRGILATIVAVGMGLLPSLVVLAVVWLGWRRDGIAALIFICLALFYAVSARDHPQWIALIAGPLVLEAVLYFVSWRMRSQPGDVPAAGT